MQNTTSPSVAALENQITERYGLLLSQTQLAELLGAPPVASVTESIPVMPMPAPSSPVGSKGSEYLKLSSTLTPLIPRRFIAHLLTVFWTSPLVRSRHCHAICISGCI